MWHHLINWTGIQDLSIWHQQGSVRMFFRGHWPTKWVSRNSRIAAFILALAGFCTLFHSDLQIILSKWLVYAENICQDSSSVGIALAATWLPCVFAGRNRTEAMYEKCVNMFPFISYTQLICFNVFLVSYPIKAALTSLTEPHTS